LRVAEFAVITLFLHTLVIFTTLPIGLLTGLTAAPPWGRLLTLTMVLWFTSLPLLVLSGAVWSAFRFGR